jgi:beta-N-acetylhexosaminidase
MSAFRKALIATLSVFLFCSHAHAQRKSSDKTVIVSSAKKAWIDSAYNALSPDERIGQLFMVSAYSGGKAYNDELITKLISEYHIGGLIFMQGGPYSQAVITNRYQHLSRTPLLIGMDAEWGIGMRFDSVKNFPRQMMLGASHDTALAFRMGAAIALQCRRLGVNIDFAPVVDVNNNPLNPVINSRSFGQEKYWVARMGIAYMRGLQNNGIMACAKHFPGHGNTDVDSHKDLPLISMPAKELDTLELYPFRQLIAAGVKSIMVAHLEVPALDDAPNTPTTLSKKTVTDLLKVKLGFNGLVFTDALNMQAITRFYPSGEADLRAFEAGNDILLFSQDVPAGLAKIKDALTSGAIPQAQLENSVRKILAAKYDAGLNKWKDIDPRHILDDLNNLVDPVRVAVARGAITIVSDENQILNKIGAGMHIGYVGINASGTTTLYEQLNDKFDNVKAQWLPKGASLEDAQAVLDNIASNDVTIVAVHNLNFAPTANYGLSSEAIAFLQFAGCRNNVMVVLMGNAYATQYFCGAGSVMVGYEDDTLTERIAAEVLLKKFKAKGRMPVSACIGGKSVCPITVKIPAMTNEPAFTLRKTLYPKDAGVVDNKALDRLDMFMARNIADGVYPGCRILAAKNGKIFYDKPFGYMKYDKLQHVDLNTLYDMASCTKVLATMLSVMHLYELGKIDLDKTIGDYLPAAKGTNKVGLHIKDLLLHQAGLKSYIPFYKETLDEKGYPSKEIYSSKPDATFNIEVAKNLYIRHDYPETMWKEIYEGPTSSPPSCSRSPARPLINMPTNNSTNPSA